MESKEGREEKRRKEGGKERGGRKETVFLYQKVCFMFKAL